jgi:hypothetical protein
MVITIITIIWIIGRGVVPFPLQRRQSEAAAERSEAVRSENVRQGERSESLLRVAKYEGVRVNGAQAQNTIVGFV